MSLLTEIRSLSPTKRKNFINKLTQEQKEYLSRVLNAEDVATNFLKEATQDVPWQVDIINDPTSFIAILGSRRVSKTTILLIKGIYTALKQPYSQLLYLGLTQDSVKQAAYDQILPRLIRTHNIPAKLLGDDEMHFNNGSILYLRGLDASKKQKNKIRGLKSSLNLIDEMQSFTQDVGLIIREVVGPAAADTKAQTFAAGTASNAQTGNYWFEVAGQSSKDNSGTFSSTLHPEWKIYFKSWEDNTSIDLTTNQRVCDNVREYLADYLTKHPGIDQDPSFRQEWKSEWVVEDSALIYRYTPANLLTSTTCTEISSEERIPAPSNQFLQSAHYILGMDTGYEDPTAFVVIAYNLKYSNKLYVIASTQKSHMLLPEVVAQLRLLDNQYHFDTKVGDSQNLQLFETITITHGIPIEKAQKQGKLSHILALNGDLLTRSVVFLPGNEELIKQLSTLTWDPKALKDGDHKEIEGKKNDLCDAFLYAHHRSRHLWYEEIKPQPKIPNPYEDIAASLLKRNRNQQVDWALPNG